MFRDSDHIVGDDMKSRGIGSILMVFGLCIGAANAGAIYMDKSYQQPSPNKGVVSVERTKHFFLNHLAARIYVDGKPVASLHGGDAINIYMPFGRHILGASAHVKETGPDQQLAVDVTANESPILRMTAANGGYSGVKLTRIK
jgi:hypothetical protein